MTARIASIVIIGFNENKNERIKNKKNSDGIETIIIGIVIKSIIKKSYFLSVLKNFFIGDTSFRIYILNYTIKI